MISLFKVNMSPDAGRRAAEVLASGYVGQGERVDEFERKFAHTAGLERYPLGVNSCSAALDLSLHLIGVGSGDEVICSPITCTATVGAIVNRGARIVWADVDPYSGLISPDDAWNKMDRKTKAIIAVDWAGRSCNYATLKSAGVPVVQDAAHRFYVDQPHGDYVCFPGSTSVETPTGPRPIASIRVGDEVVAGDGVARRVAVIHENTYDGDYARIKAGQARLVATENHPIRIHRDGSDQWLPAREVEVGDSVYLLTKSCARCETLVPYYGTVCPSCYQASAIRYNAKRRSEAAEKHAKIATVARDTSRVAHHERDVTPIMDQYEADGYRVIPIVRVIPDFIAIKDGRVTAVEVESATSVAGSKQHKYERLNGHGYDDVIWHTRVLAKDGARYKYEIIGNLVRVPVSSVAVGPSNYANRAHRRVYNLTIEDEPTYFARGFLVHNCWSFGPIKHLTCGGYGGAILPPAEQFERARLLRWHGLDRLSKADFRCSQDIVEAGYRYHMTDDQAVVGIANLPFAVRSVARARDNVRWYCKTLDGAPGITVAPYDPSTDYWLMTILADDRDGLMAHLTERGIASSQVHARCDKHTAFKRATVRPAALPGVDYFDAHQLSIPTGFWVSDQDREHIAGAVLEWAHSHAKELTHAIT